MSRFASQLDAVAHAMPYALTGQVQAVNGLAIEASDLSLPLGSTCCIVGLGGRRTMAEVIGFAADRTLLMSLGDSAGVSRGDRVENCSASPRIWCSDALLGRVIDGFGRPIDGGGPLRMCEGRRIGAKSLSPLDRQPIDRALSTGVRAIDALHTCGRGQRMGVFSGPGVGKSTLISCIAQHTQADVSVVAMIGERGREVQEFLQHSLGDHSRGKCVVVVSTADDPPLLRVRAAKVACTVAEYFRDRGSHVLLLMDSLTRLCQAQRQIGLSGREPPATRGFPPSVFALLPEVIERAGSAAHGSITGFYTVLVEGDDFNEPIPDAVKGITDGHLWLNRALAERGHYPAIDPLQSISRLRGQVSDAEQQRCARRITSLIAAYQEIEDLVNIGAYVAGSSPLYDLAIQARPKINQFLQQEPDLPSAMEQTRRELLELCAWIDQADAQQRKIENRKSAVGN